MRSIKKEHIPEPAFNARFFIRTAFCRRMIFLLFLFILTAAESKAQDQDFRTWWTLDLKKEITPSFAASLELSERFSENSTRFNRSLFTLKLFKDLNKNVFFDGGYRYYVIRNEELGIQTRTRIHSSVILSERFSDLELSLRGRFHYEYGMFSKVDMSRTYCFMSRTCLEGKYYIRNFPLTPYAYYEGWFDLLGEGDPGLWAQHFRGGFEVPVNENNTLTFSYLQIKPTDESSTILHVFFFNYDYIFN